MQAKKFFSFFIFQIILLLIVIKSNANDFLDTPDDVAFFELYGNGTEAGFFTLVKFIADEDRLPKQPLLPGSVDIDAEILYQKLLLLEPQIVFLENTANCEVFQGPYYNLNNLVSHGTEVSFSYLIKTDSHLSNASCILELYVLGETLPRKTVKYFTKR